jgi:hypothetical protein
MPESSHDDDDDDDDMIDFIVKNIYAELKEINCMV